jgi:hypothetical protein
MQKSTLLAIVILAALLLSAVFTVATAQQTPAGSGQGKDKQDNTLTGMAIGAGTAIFTVGLIGVLFFRKQN